MSIHIGRIVIEDIVIDSGSNSCVYECCDCPVSTPVRTYECCGSAGPTPVVGPSGPAQPNAGPVPYTVSYSTYPKTINDFFGDKNVQDFKKSFQPEALLKTSVDLLQKVCSSTGGVSDEFLNRLVNQASSTGGFSDEKLAAFVNSFLPHASSSTGTNSRNPNAFVDSLSSLATSVLRSLSAPVENLDKKQKETAEKWEAILNSTVSEPNPTGTSF
jgi:hypothetical protein